MTNRPVSLQTRKPIAKLNLADLNSYPVWEYAHDEEAAQGRDETWVRPVDCSMVPPRRYVHVASEFVSACGKRFDGFVTVSTLDGYPEVCQGSIILGDQSLFVANPEAFCFDESRADLLAKVNLTEGEMFPLAFRLRVLVAKQSNYAGGTLP